MSHGGLWSFDELTCSNGSNAGSAVHAQTEAVSPFCNGHGRARTNSSAFPISPIDDLFRLEYSGLGGVGFPSPSSSGECSSRSRSTQSQLLAFEDGTIFGYATDEHHEAATSPDGIFEALVAMTPEASSTTSSSIRNNARSCGDSIRPGTATDEDDPYGSDDEARPPRETAEARDKRAQTLPSHRVNEARYRSKLNDKMFQLQLAVPTLRVAINKRRGLSDESDLHGLEAARNLRKGTVMAKTIEYIQKLERANTELAQQVDRLNEELALATTYHDKGLTQKLEQLRSRCTEIGLELVTL